jgi:hypothetical protein
MKVLVPGTLKEFELEVTCTADGNKDTGSPCGALLLVNKDDIFITRSSSMGRYEEEYYTICCPDCKSLTDIPERLLPGHIKEEAEKRRWGSGSTAWQKLYGKENINV